MIYYTQLGISMGSSQFCVILIINLVITYSKSSLLLYSLMYQIKWRIVLFIDSLLNISQHHSS